MPVATGISVSLHDFGRKNARYEVSWIDPRTGEVRVEKITTADYSTAKLIRDNLESELNLREGHLDAAAFVAIHLRQPFPTKKPDKSKNQLPRWVYFISGGPLVKIGKAADSNERARQIQFYCPTPLRVIHVIRSDDATWLESHIHGYFAAKRDHGEWFALTEDDIAMLKGVDVWNPHSGPQKLVIVPDPFVPPREQSPEKSAILENQP